ncbi:unnamed protein product [Urochloa decumbens]|uniref:Exocyst subunit Exo70 family protein n=1 Tax=Urochloa decumbens TaxID=240449 RepID=A0ABC8VLV5_9POAL
MALLLATVSEGTEFDFTSETNSEEPWSYADTTGSTMVGRQVGFRLSSGSSSYRSRSSCSNNPSTQSHPGCRQCDQCPMGLAGRMVRNGSMQALISAFSRESGVLERWFSELDLDFVLVGTRGSNNAGLLATNDHCSRWGKGLTVMALVLSGSITQGQLRGDWQTARAIRDGVASIKNYSVVEAGLSTVALSDAEPYGLWIARFAEACFSTMLTFAATLTAEQHQRLTFKLSRLLDMHSYISNAWETLMPSLLGESRLLLSNEMKNLVRKIDSDFSRERHRLGEAIWRMTQETKALISRKDSWETIPQDGDIHKTTELILEFVTQFLKNESVLNSIVWRFSDFWYDTSAINVVMDMVHDMERQLEEKSQSLSDPSLRYFFMVNNSHFIKQKLICSYKVPFWSLCGRNLKVESYVKTYLEVSWGPVIACLHNTTTLSFRRRSSLAKFHSEFKKICRVQKLWKVRDPDLRFMLRNAIISKVIPEYKKHLEERKDHQEENSIDFQRSSTEDLEDTLKELFEG